MKFIVTVLILISLGLVVEKIKEDHLMVTLDKLQWSVDTLSLNVKKQRELLHECQANLPPEVLKTLIKKHRDDAGF